MLDSMSPGNGSSSAVPVNKTASADAITTAGVGAMMQAPIEEESSHQGEIWSEIEQEISKSNVSGNGIVDDFLY